MSTSKIKTRRVRIIAMPERVMTKDHNRDYGKERKHPKTVGWRRKTVSGQRGRPTLGSP